MEYILYDARNIELKRGDIQVHKIFGSFDLAVTLPENMNMGDTSLTIKGFHNKKSVEFTHKFVVQEVFVLY